MTEKTLKETVKDPVKTNQWKKGESGNKLGRPVGSKNKATLIREAIEGDVAEVIGKDVVSVLEKAVEMALEGDTAMIKLVADKFIPNAKIETDKKGNKGFGGIKIIVGSIHDKPVIDAEIIEDEEYEEG